MTRRAILSCLILSACFLFVEGYLRLAPGLPSLRASVVPFQPKGRPSVISVMPDIPGCVGPDKDDKPVAWQQTFGEGTDPAIRILVAGDSITLGDGVRPEETYAGRIGADIARRKNRPVEVVNAGVNAAGYCHVIRAVHGHLSDDNFDHVLVGLFADDLEQRAVTLEGGTVRADPRLVDGVVGALATHSYVLNWVWLKVVEAAVVSQTGGGTHPAPHVTRPGRKIPARSLQNFEASIKGLQKYSPIFVLIPPVGGPLCSKVPEPGSECAWLQSDMEQMAKHLGELERGFVDLRNLWADGVDHTQSMEQRWWREHRRLPVHPNADGHARIAEGLLSSGQVP